MNIGSMEQLALLSIRDHQREAQEHVELARLLPRSKERHSRRSSVLRWIGAWMVQTGCRLSEECGSEPRLAPAR